MANSDDKGCLFLGIVIICVAIGLIMLGGEIFKAIGESYRDNPGNVIGGFFIVAFIAFIIYKVINTE